MWEETAVKLTDTVEKAAEACSKTTLSGEYDVTVKLNTPKNNSGVLFRAVGNDSAKVLRYAVSAAIVAGGTILMRSLKKSR